MREARCLCYSLRERSILPGILELTAMPILDRRSALRHALLAGGLGLPVMTAAQQGPARLRGTIAGLDGAVLTVALRDGGQAPVMLAEPLTVLALRRVPLAEIVVGTAVGVVAVPDTDGALKAVAITVLPPGARITELQTPWDLGPETSMNNGPVTATVDKGGVGELTLSILGKAVLVRVPPDAPLLMPIPATRADLKPGAPVFINATRGADGALSATRVVVGKDGVSPAI